MGIGEAKSLCPDLIVMPYQYDRYQVISEQVGRAVGLLRFHLPVDAKFALCPNLASFLNQGVANRFTSLSKAQVRLLASHMLGTWPISQTILKSEFPQL